ncbi:MAG: sulfatase-like hydrolase/transferase [Proteobacteria bacterium]|nr:sulfatase-like hydrolase/transferase [Pseudomonadota bacterium]
MRTSRLECLVIMLFLASCTCGEPTTPPPAERPLSVTGELAKTFALSVNVPFAELDIPKNSRPDGAEPPDNIPLTGKWDDVSSRRSDQVGYRTPIPVRPRGLFFSKPPDGSVVFGPGGDEISHQRNRVGKNGYWTYSKTTISLFLPADAHPPEKGGYTLRYPPSVAREAKLNWEFSGIEDAAEFVRTRVQSGSNSLSGLLLPAPGTAAWEIELPPAAELRFNPGLVVPEIQQGDPSDGVSLAIEVEVEGQKTELWSKPLELEHFAGERVDLSRWAGKKAIIRFRTLPGAKADYDYAFVVDPVVASRKKNPRRVFLAFVDTLRTDHLATYGYERPTSPSLDALAKNGVVFENARSVAPWTLPSARSIVTGRLPEYYDVSQTLQGRLRNEGWASAMFAGNLYLAPNFGLHRDWGRQHVVLWPSAEEQVDLATAWLEENEGRDAIVLVQFMDPHLPYLEPDEYRHKFAGEPTHGLGDEFHRGEVLRARIRSQEDASYILDRYDNNILYVNDQLQRIYDVMDDDDIVVYFADHGEEFWDHRGFEHGHSLYDELLHVPLVIKAPGIGARRVAEPVSLMDIVPTVLDLLGLRAENLDGSSLVDAMVGDTEALDFFRNRDQVFGYPLYGAERWGVLHQNEKYTSHEGREVLFDLTDDPLEKKDLFSGQAGDVGAAYRQYMGDALGREVAVGYRLTPTATRTGVGADCVATLTVPGGIKAAWVGDDPTRASSAAVRVVSDKAIATWHKGFRGSREVYVIPVEPMDEVTNQLVLHVVQGQDEATAKVPKNRKPTLDTIRSALARAKVGSRVVSLTFAVAPIPDAQTQALDGYDSELADMLITMGYAVGNESDDDDEEVDEVEEDEKSPKPPRGKSKAKGKRKRPR